MIELRRREKDTIVINNRYYDRVREHLLLDRNIDNFRLSQTVEEGDYFVSRTIFCDSFTRGRITFNLASSASIPVANVGSSVYVIYNN